MDCIIIDDEKMARVIIKTLCDQVNSLNLVHEFSNAIQAIKYLNEHKVDLVFLDIHMPNFSGLDFVKTIKNPPKIIFTTSDPQFAIKAFEYDFIVDYLLKPIELQRFEKAIKKVETQLFFQRQTSQKSELDLINEFYVNIDRRLIKIDLHSIYLIEAKGDYIHIKTEDGNYVVHSTLKKIEEKLPDSLFLKVHRSYLINVKKIIDIEDNSVLIKKDLVPVSRSKRNELMKRLDLL
ncbi:MAG: LytTR family DNA-binding domain-containing protein [Polaribacter sp.]|uniref:LytR/AlgR family response regulator transcription factor n=1 Tax=Polaribacter sp. TaxID=1920175 RepID=UPI002626D1FA|nr:LytTR family DNA-binding domain-containing protein [Polaribacter sp.]MBT3741141.1 response regulator transcription factor [Polaribacter sp.]MBT7815858.1 response regulator transcription factor [Polaribacter sp.]MDG1194645.1 LytTR family DNA-binding domain-containing protein [Polaribacter sp.]MDG1404332.1 LytTR family DNA-binding domain-containing protein [Polaribacter sp.]